MSKQNKPKEEENKEQTTMLEDELDMGEKQGGEGFDEEEPEKKSLKFGMALHKACGSGASKPAQQYIQFKDGFANATDGDIVLHISLKDLKFPEAEIEQLNGYYVHKDSFAHIWNKEIDFIADGVIASVERIEVVLIDAAQFRELTTAKEGGITTETFPHIEDFIKNVGKEMPLYKLGLSGHVAKTFFDIVSGKQLSITFPTAGAKEYKMKITFIGMEESIAFVTPFVIADKT